MEQRNNFTAVGIDSGNIGPFVPVAVVARQSQVRSLIAAFVLPGDDVVDMKGGEGNQLLRESAVLAMVARPQTDKASHALLFSLTIRTALALACKTPTKSRALT